MPHSRLAALSGHARQKQNGPTWGPFCFWRTGRDCEKHALACFSSSGWRPRIASLRSTPKTPRGVLSNTGPLRPRSPETKWPHTGGPFCFWRTGRDSNPRYPCRYTRFPSVRLQPLGHLSARRAGLYPLASSRQASHKSVNSILTGTPFWWPRPSTGSPFDKPPFDRLRVRPILTGALLVGSAGGPSARGLCYSPPPTRNCSRNFGLPLGGGNVRTFKPRAIGPAPARPRGARGRLEKRCAHKSAAASPGP